MKAYSSTIYKADQRRSETSEFARNYSTMSQAFGDLKYLNDVYLAPGKELDRKRDASVQEILLPVAGTITYRDASISEKFLAAEEVLFPVRDGNFYSVKNSYETEMINYLQIGLCSSNNTSQTRDYTVAVNEFNKINSLSLNKIDCNSYAGVGVYTGRTKGSYTLKNPGNGIFAYIINGAFEFENRLLEHRDGLALWDTKKIEFESLSHFSLLLLLEIPLNA